MAKARKAPELDVEMVERVHKGLRAISIKLKRDPDIPDLRHLFADIRRQRNRVARTLGSLMPLAAKIRADLVRVERVIDAETAMRIERRQDLMDDGEQGREKTTAPQRAARVKVALRSWYDARADLKADMVVVDEVLAHAKMVREELRYGYEEASRSLASIDLEKSISLHRLNDDINDSE